MWGMREFGGWLNLCEKAKAAVLLGIWSQDLIVPPGLHVAEKFTSFVPPRAEAQLNRKRLWHE
jgi:hypothetical protein